jgi:hypothetical protein
MTDKEKRTRKYMEDQRHKRRLERLAKSESSYPAGAVWIEEKCIGNDQWEQLEKPFAIRTHKSRHSIRYRYFKNVSNRKIRRNKQVVPKGGTYKKFFDYQWTVD